MPKSFNFNSTGHVNSPETVVIRKTLRSTTPDPKTVKGRKSGRGNSWGGRQEKFKTPAKGGTVSSMKTASSAKKGQSMKVRFSLHNEVQSPSGKRMSIKQTEANANLGSPMVPSKRYNRTPRRSRLSEASALHASIKEEESPLFLEVSTSQLSSAGSSARKSNKQSSDAYDFSIYSPSSPTLEFSHISGVSSQNARKSIDFSDFSPVSSESSESPKRKRSMPSLNNTTQSVSSARKFSFAARRSVSQEKSSPNQFQPSPDNNARLSSSDLFGSSFGSSAGKSKKTARLSFTSTNTSGVFKMSPNTSQSSVKSSGNISSVSQIPLPPTPYGSRSGSKSKATPSSSKSSGSVRSTRSYKSDAIETPKSFKSRSSKSELSLGDSKILANESPQAKKRISSTPKPKSLPSQSPSTSPILSTEKRSFRNKNVTESEDDPSSVLLDVTTVSSPRSSGKKGRKGSTRMTASNSNLLSPETQVPILAVRPSTIKKQLNESISSLSESVAMSNLSVSQDVSGRSIDRNLAQKLLDSRASTPLAPRSGRSTPSSALLHDLSISPNSTVRRRRKSASTSSLSDATTFDFNSALTPQVPRGVFVSPLDDNVNDLSDLAGMKRVMNPTGNSPVSSYTDVRGVKRLLRTPQASTPIANYTSVEGIKRLFKQSPTSNYADISGLNLLYQLSTNEANLMNVKGVRRTPNSSDVTGVEVLFESPKKTVETFTKQSPQKPVGMVPPMSRSSLVVNQNVEVVDLTEPAVSGSRPRRTNNQPELTVTTSRSRKTRQTMANAQVVDEEELVGQHVEVKTRGAKGTKTVKPSTKGRNARGGRQEEKDDSDVEIIESIPEITSTVNVVKKEQAGNKRKLPVLDSVEPPVTVGNKRTRGRNVVTEDKVSEKVQTKAPKTNKSSTLQDKESESLQQTELPTKRGGRKLRGEPISPLQQKDPSPKAKLGKRGKPLSAEPMDVISPPKKAKRGKQVEVEAVASPPKQTTPTQPTKNKGKSKQVKDAVVDVPPVATIAARAGKATSTPMRKGKLVSPVKAATRSKKGTVVTVSPVIEKTPSPVKPRGQVRKGKKDTTELPSEVVKIESPKRNGRTKRGKVEDIPKSPEKSKSPSPVKAKRKTRKTQIEVPDSPMVKGQSPAKSRGRKTVITAEISKSEESTKTTRRGRGKPKTEAVAQSPERPIEKSPGKEKPRGRRGKVEKSHIEADIPVESETQAVSAKTKGRRKQTNAPQVSEKTTESPKKTKLRGKQIETAVEAVDTKPEPKKGPRIAKSQPSPVKTVKGKGKQKEVTTSTKKSPVKVNKRLKKESLSETKPSTSRQTVTQTEEQPPKPSRRVQFNT